MAGLLPPRALLPPATRRTCATTLLRSRLNPRSPAAPTLARPNPPTATCRRYRARRYRSSIVFLVPYLSFALWPTLTLSFPASIRPPAPRANRRVRQDFSPRSSRAVLRPHPPSVRPTRCIAEERQHRSARRANNTETAADRAPTLPLPHRAPAW